MYDVVATEIFKTCLQIYKVSVNPRFVVLVHDAVEREQAQGGLL
jgi:hypothetical protein